MTIAHEKLPGLDRERVLAAVEPILAAHRWDDIWARVSAEIESALRVRQNRVAAHSA